MCITPSKNDSLRPPLRVMGDSDMEVVKRRSDKEGLAYRPKVKIQRHNSLFIISYCEVPPKTSGTSPDNTGVSTPRNFNVYLYIDIPTIDYYNDELTDNKLSKFNKKFKLHLLREAVYKSFTDGNDLFWDNMMRSDEKGKTCTISISSSGSLRYVETTKFLMETLYERLVDFIDAGKLTLKFKVEVSPTSHKWFITFLDKKLISRKIIKFIETGSYLKFSENSSTPFKEYYSQLNSKFTSKGSCLTDTLDSISIITNLTGVKALLTILSDRPLTSYILQDSIDALHDSCIMKKRPKDTSTDFSEEETLLKRESSSLLSFQNSLVTSNKDKAVRVRSSSLNRKLHRGQNIPSEELSIYKTTSRDTNSSPNGATVQLSPNSASSAVKAGAPNLNEETYVKDGEEGDYEDDDDDEEEEEDAEEEGEENNSDDGISFSVPSKLSRSGSSLDIANGSQHTTRPGRFRSLSLMDPAYQVPFHQRGHSASLDATEDEASSVDGKKVTNIYVHDGEFDDSCTPKRGKKKLNKNILSRQNSGNGLIPPEFYSRISSPSTSASSSNSSLQNLNMAPGTFSKWLGPNDSSKVNVSHQEVNTNTLFEKKLIDKSFEEHRKQNSINLFSALIGGLNLSNDKKPLALNFKSNKVIPPEIQVLDEEDLLMSGFHNGNGNFSADETSEDERKSSSTVIGETPSYSGLDSVSSSNANRKPANDTPTTNSSFKGPVLNLNFQLYDKNDNANKENIQGKNDGANNGQETSKPKYKKAVQLDLYGDDDLDNMGGWILGGNAR